MAFNLETRPMGSIEPTGFIELRVRPDAGACEISTSEVYQGNYALGIDIGSTAVKIRLFNLRTGKKIKIKAEEENSWLPYQKQVKENEWKITDGIEFTQNIFNQASAVLRKFGLTNEDLGGIVLTGFTNSLVISAREKSVIILDEPSLTTELTEGEKEIIAKYLDSSELKKSSSLMKLLALRDNPNLIEELLGPGINFEDLKFNTALGLVGSALADFSAIPQPDIYGFSTRRKIAEEEKTVQSMLEELGFSEEQIHFGPGLSCFGNDEQAKKCLFFVNDFMAEIEMIGNLYKREYLSPEDITLSTDSVFKVIGLTEDDDKSSLYKRIGEEGLWYLTQRMGGNVYGEWMWHLVRDNFLGSEMNDDFFSFIDRVIGEAFLKTDNPYFYFPEDGENGDSIGVLYKEENGERKRISLDEAESYSWEERKKIIASIFEGIIFGIRQKLELIRDFDSIKRTICYGGIVKDPLHDEGRLRVINACLDNKVYLLEGFSSAAQAAIYLAAAKLEIKDRLEPPSPEINHFQQKNQEDFSKAKQRYQRWQQLLQ